MASAARHVRETLRGYGIELQEMKEEVEKAMLQFKEQEHIQKREANHKQEQHARQLQEVAGSVVQQQEARWEEHKKEINSYQELVAELKAENERLRGKQAISEEHAVKFEALRSEGLQYKHEKE